MKKEEYEEKKALLKQKYPLIMRKKWLLNSRIVLAIIIFATGKLG